MPERPRLKLSVPDCGDEMFCDPITEHTDNGYIRNRCEQCGKIGPWIQVLVPDVEGHNDHVLTQEGSR